ncbi:AraC family transcriptional regulator [Paenibacillus sp. FSL R7-0273]|uniref:helix-turn-helix transcriptional regulator n=1 Tax=Paenibacillus sp. FSL R7-0273 TaxID=1536772 RepID=UPI00117F5689
MQRCTYITYNMCEQLSIELISARLSFSPYHFHRVFHYLTGIAIMEYDFEICHNWK